MGKPILDVQNAIEFHNAQKEKKLNKVNLAKKMKVSYQTLMNYQKGNLPEGIRHLFKLSKITGVTDINKLIKIK